MKHGDFSRLASIYDKYRPGYPNSVLTAVLSLLKKPIAECTFADIGAGTGKWTRMLASTECRKVFAVEPNLEMREQGIVNSSAYSVEWREGSGEATGLADASCDLVSMASAFHWTDFNKSTCEFHRILKPGGIFTALWNTRFIEDSPLLVDIEQKLVEIKSDLKRVSSVSSGIASTLTEDLLNLSYFDDVVFIEGRHNTELTVEAYLGAWKSVNDIQVQLGEDGFAKFLNYVEDKLHGLDSIAVCYKTRAWVARKPG
jgi:SAM-dependent methyltransferase